MDSANAQLWLAPLLQGEGGLSLNAASIMEQARHNIEGETGDRERVQAVLTDTVRRLCAEAAWPKDESRVVMALN